MIYLDNNGLDTQNYNFDYVRREFLGEVRTLVFDVTPKKKRAKGASSGASGSRTRTTRSFDSTAPIPATTFPI